MKTTNNWLTILIVFVVGVLLIVWHSRIDIFSWIVIAVGVMLIIPSLYSFISALVRKGTVSEGSSTHSAATSTLIACVAALALGIWMVVNPPFFVGLIAYIFGGLLVLYGIFHILVVGFWNREFSLPFFFYIIPVLMIVAGVVILATSVRTISSVVVLITGIALVASAVNSVMENVGTRQIPDKHREA
ncbi:MAG: DUF308 domain-containing protein [Bacteroidales bacterium]|nr:DUF308 domain-containing protein [Bacteroidales bacterium]